MDVVRLGIIGVGNMGLNHARSVLTGEVGRCVLTAVCDIDPARLVRFEQPETADLGKLTSDTIIVLCDGATVAGPDWVVPTLAAIKESSRLVFNCVQIGRGGDACLQLLARESGGDFIHVKD